MDHSTGLTAALSIAPYAFKALALKRFMDYFNKGIDAIAKGLKKKIDKATLLKQAEAWTDEYLAQLETRVSKVQILGMLNPIDLKQLFVPPSFWEQLARETYTSQDAEVPEHFARRFLIAGDKKVTINSLLKHDRVAILGGPGAGKSTVMRNIVLNCINDSKAPLPIYIELRHVEDVKDFVDYLIKQVGVDLDSDLITVLRNLIISADCIILLDALDEVKPSRVEYVVRMIERLTARNRSSKIFISCRTPAYTAPSEGFVVFEIAEFTQAQRDRFIANWFAAKEQEQHIEPLRELLSRSEGISELTTNPLLLSLICLLYENEIDLPRKRSELYKRCVEVLVRDWDTKRGFKRESICTNLSPDGRIALFSQIAEFFFRKSIRFFTLDALRDFVNGITLDYGVDSIDTDAVLNELESHHGIVIKVGAEEHGFSHYTIQEYLTAFYFYNRQNSAQLIEEYAREPRWREVLLLNAGLLGTVQPLITAIITSKKLSRAGKLDLIEMLINEKMRFDETSRRAILNYLKKSLHWYYSDYSIIQNKFTGRSKTGFELVFAKRESRIGDIHTEVVIAGPKRRFSSSGWERISGSMERSNAHV